MKGVLSVTLFDLLAHVRDQLLEFGEAGDQFFVALLGLLGNLDFLQLVDGGLDLALGGLKAAIASFSEVTGADESEFEASITVFWMPFTVSTYSFFDSVELQPATMSPGRTARTMRVLTVKEMLPLR